MHSNDNWSISRRRRLLNLTEKFKFKSTQCQVAQSLSLNTMSEMKWANTPKRR